MNESNALNVNLPNNPSETEIEYYTFENKWVCHNRKRELDINNRIQELEIRLEDQCKQIEVLAQDISPEVNLGLFPSFKWGEFSVGVSIGVGVAYLLLK